jgi:hypothetical protein
MELYQVLLKFTFKICRVFLLINLVYSSFWTQLHFRFSPFAKLTVIAYLLTLSFMLNNVVFKFYSNLLPEVQKLVDLKEEC